MRFRRSSLVTVVLASLACQDATGPLPQARVTVESQPTVFVSGRRASVRMRVTVFNPGTVPLYRVNGCAAYLERRVGTAWRVVGGTGCLSISSPPVEILPGERDTFEFNAEGDLDGAWAAPIDGAYRVQVLVSGRRRGVGEAQRRSAPITLREQLHPAMTPP